MFIILQDRVNKTLNYRVNWLSTSNQLFKYPSGVWLWRQDPLVASYDKQGLANEPWGSNGMKIYH